MVLDDPHEIRLVKVRGEKIVALLLLEKLFPAYSGSRREVVQSAAGVDGP